jgi:hypothetical protein
LKTAIIMAFIWSAQHQMPGSKDSGDRNIAWPLLAGGLTLEEETTFCQLPSSWYTYRGPPSWRGHTFLIFTRCLTDLCHDNSRCLKHYIHGDTFFYPYTSSFDDFNLITEYVTWNAESWDWQSSGSQLSCEGRLTLGPSSEKMRWVSTQSVVHSWNISEKPRRGGVTPAQKNLPTPVSWPLIPLIGEQLKLASLLKCKCPWERLTCPSLNARVLDKRKAQEAGKGKWKLARQKHSFHIQVHKHSMT